MGRNLRLTYTVFFLFTGLLLCSSGCRSKVDVSESEKKPLNLSTEVKELVDQIISDNYIGTEQVARKPVVDPAFERRLKLMRIATDSELLALSGNPNPVVSLIAFEGLYNRGNSTVPAIFEGLRKRNDIIHYLRGDLSMEMPMLEYAYVYVLDYNIPDEEPPSEIIQSEPKFALSEEVQSAVIERIDGLRADGQ